VRTVLSRPRNAEPIAALVARASALIERVDRVAAKATPQKRAQLETAVAVMKRLLAKIGYRGTA
jgi:hypothetical protein